MNNKFRRALRNGLAIMQAESDLQMILKEGYQNKKRYDTALRLYHNIDLTFGWTFSNKTVSDNQNRINCLNNPNEIFNKEYLPFNFAHPWLAEHREKLSLLKFEKIQRIYERKMTKKEFMTCIRDVITADLLGEKTADFRRISSEKDLKEEFQYWLKEIAETPYVDGPTYIPKRKGIIGLIQDKFMSYFGRKRFYPKPKYIF
jgi:hypothetical protein